MVFKTYNTKNIRIPNFISKNIASKSKNIDSKSKNIASKSKNIASKSKNIKLENEIDILNLKNEYTLDFFKKKYEKELNLI